MSYATRRKLRLKPSPQMDENGCYLPDHQGKTEVFVTWEELQTMCRECVVDGPMPTYKDDDTYNMKRRK